MRVRIGLHVQTETLILISMIGTGCSLFAVVAVCSASVTVRVRHCCGLVVLGRHGMAWARHGVVV